MYYTNFNDSLHILNEIYTDFSGTQERIADLYSYTQKISDIINTKKEGLQELCLQKVSTPACFLIRSSWRCSTCLKSCRLLIKLRTLSPPSRPTRARSGMDRLLLSICVVTLLPPIIWLRSRICWRLPPSVTSAPWTLSSRTSRRRRRLSSCSSTTDCSSIFFLLEVIRRLVHTDEEEKNDSYANTVYPNVFIPLGPPSWPLGDHLWHRIAAYWESGIHLCSWNDHCHLRHCPNQTGYVSCCFSHSRRLLPRSRSEFEEFSL